ncbi:hypothetical protein QUB52_24245, partial [Microcoleus sp. A6-C6]
SLFGNFTSFFILTLFWHTRQSEMHPVTSYTDVDDYLPYRVPEVWLFKQNRLRIYCLEDEGYVETSISRYFPDFNISELVLECYQMSRDRNTSVAIRELRRKVEMENH